jgi:hypothetical protein
MMTVDQRLQKVYFANALPTGWNAVFGVAIAETMEM